VDTGALRHTLTEHRDVVDTVAFSANGKFLASGSWDKLVAMLEGGT
jgi:WD40 repeat protein